MQNFRSGPRKLFEVNPGWSINWLRFHFWDKNLPTLGNELLVSNLLLPNINKLRYVEIELGTCGLYDNISDFLRAKQRDVLLLQTLEPYSDANTRLKLEIEHRKMICEINCFFHDIFPVDDMSEQISTFGNFLMNALISDRHVAQAITPGSVYDHTVGLYIRGTITNLHLLQILPKLKHLAVHGLNSLSTVELPQITELSIYNQVTAENLSTTIERVFKCLQTFRFYPALESKTSFLKTKFQLPRSCKNIETSQSQLEMFTLAKDFEELSLTIMESREDRTVEVNRVIEFSHNLVSLQLRYGYDETIDELFNHLLELAHHLPKLRKLSVNAFNI